MALQSALEPHLGRRAVLSMLRVMPSLLNTSSDTLGWHYEEVASMFGAETAASLVVKCVLLVLWVTFTVTSERS